MKFLFEKYEGSGNDFVVIEAESPDSPLTAAQIAQVCDRRRGIGADGVLLTGWRNGRLFMRVHNADGSVPEMCGNGLRCVALHWFRRGAVDESAFSVDTDAGEHRCVVHAGGVRVDMAVPSLRPSALPLVSDAPWIAEPVDRDARRQHVTAVSMGNPHAVLFDVPKAEQAAWGPYLERSSYFPEGVNVGFARVVAPDQVELRVWERGVGWTDACGTGACAAVVAAVENGLVSRSAPVCVRLPGGELTIVVGEPGERVQMTGPARHVFHGEWSGLL